MLNLKTTIATLVLAACTVSAKADNLWLIGEALQYGWSTDDATALLSDPTDNTVFTGTIYLEGGKDFKFMTTTEFDNDEYGAAPDATIVDGSVKIAKGTNDTGYSKLQVTESANYYITVNTTDLTATIVKSAYQDSKITLSSLFIVGSAAPEGWDVMKGSPMYQSKEAPYAFEAKSLEMKEGTFKIAAVLKGASSWDAKYWYFRNADNANKITLGQDGDLQWSITEAETYDIAVNLKDESISINRVSSVISGITEIIGNDENTETIYYSLTGVRVDRPQKGIYIVRKGSSVSKIIVK